MVKIITRVKKEEQEFIKTSSVYSQLCKDMGFTEEIKSMSVPNLIDKREKLVELYGNKIIWGVEREFSVEEKAATELFKVLTDLLQNQSKLVKYLINWDLIKRRFMTSPKKFIKFIFLGYSLTYIPGNKQTV